MCLDDLQKWFVSKTIDNGGKRSNDDFWRGQYSNTKQPNSEFYYVQRNILPGAAAAVWIAKSVCKQKTIKSTNLKCKINESKLKKKNGEQRIMSNVKLVETVVNWIGWLGGGLLFHQEDDLSQIECHPQIKVTANGNLSYITDSCSSFSLFCLYFFRLITFIWNDLLCPLVIWCQVPCMSVSMIDTEEKSFENPSYEVGEHPTTSSMVTPTYAPNGTNQVSKEKKTDSANNLPAWWLHI